MIEHVTENSIIATVIVIRFFAWLWCKAMIYMGTKINNEPAMSMMNLASLSTKSLGERGRPCH